MEGWQVFFEIPGKPPVELREGESIIGRSRTSAVHIPETTVSRQHARVTVNDGGIVLLADLGSANGTVVNGEKVEGDRRLADGDRVLVGDAELVIRILAPAEAADATVRVVIPPLGPPPAGATVRMDFADAATPVLPTAAPGAPPAGATVAAPVPPPPPPPAAASAPRPATSVPPPPVVVPPPAAPVPPMAPAKGDVLGSIDVIDQLPLTPPRPAAASAGAGAAPLRPAGAAPAPTAAGSYGGFWIRVLAYLIDVAPMLVLSVLSVALTFFVDPTVGMLVNLLAIPYAFWVVLWMPATRGTTLGKKMLGLAIVTDGVRPGQGLGWGKAFVRLVGHFVSGLVFGIGYLLVAFTSKKQGLHDLIAGTFVVRAR